MSVARAGRMCQNLTNFPRPQKLPYTIIYLGFDAWESIKLQNKENMPAAKALLEGMFKFCSIPIKTSMDNLKLSFYDLGGDSFTTIRLVSYLNSQGFPISKQSMTRALKFK
jgi:hypothetical protein